MSGKMERANKILTNLLLAFVLVSIGFVFGKHSVKDAAQADALPAGNGRYVAVFYLHSTFRCTTCNQIEDMTGELLDSAYGNELASGEIVRGTYNFQKDTELAAKFDVAASCIVVALFDGGEIAGYRRLDEVWTLVNDQQGFDSFVCGVINEYLGKL